jgi:hypothetical protein
LLDFLLSFEFESRYQKSGRQQGVLCFGFFLVRVSTIEKKSSKTKSERMTGMTSWIFNHPISHCELSCGKSNGYPIPQTYIFSPPKNKPLQTPRQRSQAKIIKK